MNATLATRFMHNAVTRTPRWGWRLIFLALALAWCYPLIWAITGSFKTNSDLVSGSTGLVPPGFSFGDLVHGRWTQLSHVFHLENYSKAWYVASFRQYFVNSMIVSVSATLIVLIVSMMSGYVLGRYAFAGRKTLLATFAIVTFLPAGYTIIPVWKLIHAVQLDGSLIGIVIGVASGGHLLYILIFAAYFSGIPNELAEAAEVDGAGFIRTFLVVMAPMAKPAIATVVILDFIRSWNDFFLPLIFTADQPSLQTVAVGIYSNFGAGNTPDFATMCAAVVVAFAPVVLVFVLLQRYFVDGLAGAVKG